MFVNKCYGIGRMRCSFKDIVLIFNGFKLSTLITIVQNDFYICGHI